MKHSLMLAAAVFASVINPVLAADVGVSVSIGQPGFYGQIDIGDYPYPQPRVIYSQPRIIERGYVEREPIYLRVPPGHAKNWSKHCHSYNACGERVYFVRDDWYQRDYVPHYQEQRRDRYDDRRDDNKNNNRGKRGHDNSDNNQGRGH